MPPNLSHPDDRDDFPGLGWLVLLVLFTAGMTMWLLLYPFDFSSLNAKPFLGERGLSQVHKINLASNVLLFLPLGLVTGWAWRIMFPRRSLLLIILCALDAALFSALGEWLQTMLPGRTSSLNDLIANTTGGAIGGAIGVVLSARLTMNWRRLGFWLFRHPYGRRAFVVLLIVLLARTAPWDVSFETYYLRTKLSEQARHAIKPFGATKRWLVADNLPATETATVRNDAFRELGRGGLNFILFAGLSAAMVPALCERSIMRGRFSRFVSHSFIVCLTIVVFTEALHWPIRGRMLDGTDPVAGAIGVVVGIMCALMFGGRTSPSG